MNASYIIGILFGMAFIIIIAVGLFTDRLTEKRGWGRWHRIFFMVTISAVIIASLILLLELVD